MAAAELERGSPRTMLVVGGGIAGITAAVEAAEVGHEVILVEKRPYLGGRVAQFYHYFPKLCPPTCGLEINFRRIKQNENITVLTQAEIESISGGPGAYQVTIKQQPRFVNERCTACGECEKACDIEVDDEYNYGLAKRKAVYLPHKMAFPYRYVVDARYAADPRMQAAADACQYDAFDLQEQPRTYQLTVGAVVYATGWRPYDPTRLDRLGYNDSPDVISNVEMERLAAPDGPTAGKVLRPSDGKEIGSIAFVQCAGSRDENHLPYCSAVCCLASMKQASYVRELYPEADIHIFYIDIRSPGRLEDFYNRVKADAKVHWHRGKVGKVAPRNGRLVVEAEDTLTGTISTAETDLVVLATGMVPETDGLPAGAPVALDENGFVRTDDAAGAGVVGTGTCTQPLEVSCTIQDATGAALKGILQLGKE
jgi:heterodisulfide reductase subunit A-like polyferredoxin